MAIAFDVEEVVVFEDEEAPSLLCRDFEDVGGDGTEEQVDEVEEGCGAVWRPNCFCFRLSFQCRQSARLLNQSPTPSDSLIHTKGHLETLMMRKSPRESSVCSLPSKDAHAVDLLSCGT